MDVFAFFDFSNMLSHCGVGSDAIGVHEADELRLGQVPRGAGFAVSDVGFGGLEGFVQGEGGDLLATFPFLVRVDIEVISLQHEQSIGEESFVTIFELDSG